MRQHAVMTVGIPFSNQGRVSVISLVRMLKAQLRKHKVTTQQATGIHKELLGESTNEH
jgi:hypothetical protein